MKEYETCEFLSSDCPKELQNYLFEILEERGEKPDDITDITYENGSLICIGYDNGNYPIREVVTPYEMMVKLKGEKKNK